SFENITPEEVMFVQNLLNMRPRKSLNYKTPMEEFLNIKVALGTGIHRMYENQKSNFKPNRMVLPQS
ncbi:hypothetical protein MUP95_07535, partial [bacterium]|nr:hypothetical protein [bacterium]